MLTTCSGGLTQQYQGTGQYYQYRPVVPRSLQFIIYHKYSSQDPRGKSQHSQRNLPLKDSMRILKRKSNMHSHGILSWMNDVLLRLLTTSGYFAQFLGMALLNLAPHSIQFIFSNWAGKDGRESVKPLFFCPSSASNFHINWNVIVLLLLPWKHTLSLSLDMLLSGYVNCS